MPDGPLRRWGGDEAESSRVGRGLRRIGGLLAMILMLPVRGGQFLLEQTRGTRENVGRGWDYLTFDSILPPSIRGTIQWFIETIPKLFGVRDTKPWQQVGAALSVIGVALLATILTGGLLIATVVVVAGFGSIGLVRFVPAANERWNEWTAALPIKRDYDVPRWKRD